MAMDPITWLLLVTAIISIYLIGMILNRITWSRDKPQSFKEPQEPTEPSIEPQPELEAIDIQIIESPAPEKVELISEPNANEFSGRVEEGKQTPKERSEESSEKGAEEKMDEQPETEESLLKPNTSKQKELKRNDMKSMLETAQELRNELLKLKTILKKSKS